MAQVKIEKFIDGKHETSFSVPAFVLGLARTLLPESALSSLANSGINVQEILEAKKKQIPYIASIDRFRQPRHRLQIGHELRFLLQAEARIHWGVNGWHNPQDCVAEDCDLGHFARLPTTSLKPGDSVQFTFFWPLSGHWEGRDFSISVI